MNTITLTLCASTRTGCLSAPIHSCADERLTLAGDLTLSAGTSVALITQRGNTLAHTILSEECAPGATIPLSTLTAQAAEYTRSCRAGDTREAILAIGESEHPLALIPARIAQNPLYTLAPPADLAPAYPTTETLKSLLAEMQAASNAAAQSATAARKSAEEAGESASSAASDRATAVNSATSAQGYAEDAQTAQGKAEAAKTDAEAAKTDAASSANAAAESELKALAYKNAAEASVETAGSYRNQAIDSAKKAEQLANTAATHALKASSSASKAANSATDAAQKAADGVTALLQGKVEAAEAAKTGAEAAKNAAEDSKTAAETAQGKAEAAKTAAETAQGKAEDAQTAAAKSATDLADAVATAKSLDGRVTAIEDEGIAYYNPLKGTPFIIEREIIAGVYLVRLRDYPSSNYSLVSNGEHYVATYNYGRTFAFLDKDLKPLREIATGFSSNAHSPAFIHNGLLWVSCLSSTWMPSAKDNIIRVYDVSDASSAPTVVAKTMKIIGDYNKNDIIALFLNRLTGNVLCIRNTMVNTGSYALEVYRLTIDGDTFAYDYVQTLDGVSLSGNNPYPLINYFANRVFVTLVASNVGYASGFNPYGTAYPVSRSVESRLLVTGYDDKLHWIDTALPPDSNTSEIPIRFGVSAVGPYFGSSVSSNVMTSATPGLQYHSTKSYTDKNGVSRPAVLMTNGVATFRSDGEDDDGNLIWKTSWDFLFNSGSFGLFTPAGKYQPVVLCAGNDAGGGVNAGYLRPTAFVYRNDVSLSAQAVGNCIRVKTTGTGGNGQNGIILLGESGNVGAAGSYGSSGGLFGSNYGVACDRHNASPTALVFTRP